jgi:hypothetical protein
MYLLVEESGDLRRLPLLLLVYPEIEYTLLPYVTDEVGQVQSQ